jgi:hypothetical protein
MSPITAIVVLGDMAYRTPVLCGGAFPVVTKKMRRERE